MSRDGLHSKVLDFYPHRDSRGREFIAYCGNVCHQGIVLRPEVCESRKCEDYYKFYIPKKR